MAFSDRPPVFAARAPQQPPPVPQPPQIQQYGYGTTQHQQPPYPPAGGATPYPPVPPTNTPYPPQQINNAAYPPYPTSNMGSVAPYPPAYPPASGTVYSPYSQAEGQPIRNEENNSGTITSEHLKVSKYLLFQ